MLKPSFRKSSLAGSRSSPRRGGRCARRRGAAAGVVDHPADARGLHLRLLRRRLQRVARPGRHGNGPRRAWRRPRCAAGRAIQARVRAGCRGAGPARISRVQFSAMDLSLGKSGASQFITHTLLSGWPPGSPSPRRGWKPALAPPTVRLMSAVDLFALRQRERATLTSACASGCCSRARAAPELRRTGYRSSASARRGARTSRATSAQYLSASSSISTNSRRAWSR